LFFFTIFRWFRRLVYLVVAVAFLYLVVTSVQVIAASRSADTVAVVKPAAAIVVIGSPTGALISPDLKARCDDAIALLQAGKARTIVVTGGSSGSGDPTEASVAKNFLQSEGIAHVTMDPRSAVPSQLSFVRALVPRSSRRVTIVADPLQTKWLEDVASAENLDAQVVGAPVPKGGFWHDVGVIWGQTVAVALGRIIGYKNTGWIG
jgi:vancomycin permeability regulator SanA